jgi:aryl-alcohol dehydrogenase-like predicted oxidoreductase
MVGQSLKGGWGGRAKIITKLSPLQDCPEDASGSTLNAFVDASIYKSCSALRVQRIEVLMLHRLSHLSDWNGEVWHRLLELQASGLIGELGASVQNPEELSRALGVPEIRYIQLPFNLLDWRWDSIIPKLLAAKASRNVTIHVRSALLQGLLASMDDRHWMRANVENASPVRDWLSKQVAVCQRANVTDLCLGYVNAMPWIDGIAIGVDNIGQLRENIGYFTSPGLTEAQVDEIENTRPRLDEATLNPALWKQATP